MTDHSRLILSEPDVAEALKKFLASHGWPKRSMALALLSSMLQRSVACDCETCQMMTAALIVAQTDVTTGILLYGEEYSPEGVVTLATRATTEELAEAIQQSVAQATHEEPDEEPPKKPADGEYEYYVGPRRPI